MQNNSLGILNAAAESWPLYSCTVKYPIEIEIVIYFRQCDHMMQFTRRQQVDD